jgi:predicted nucleic acid-binding protein
MFLVDTNVWLELLLEQQKAREVRQFLERHEAVELAITEFSLYSIGIILTRLKKDELFADFLADTLEGSGLLLIRLDVRGLNELLTVRQKFGLDFDDAYQYVAAESHDLTLLSFDSDFDRTERGRKTPAEVAG